MIIFKFTEVPLDIYDMVGDTITYFYGSCKYFVFGDNPSATYPLFYVRQDIDTRNFNGVDQLCAIFTFYLDLGKGAPGGVASSGICFFYK